MEIKLTLTEQEVNVLAAGLGKLPFEVAYPVFMKLQQQVAEQAKKPESDNG